jgi:uncharacterized coiled-coil protein SlyX
MITPILKDPRKHGGTLYTFPSASRDLTRAFSNSEYEFAFSNFACLNLPDFRYGTFKDGDLKGVYLDNIYKGCIDSLSGNDILNTALKWHLQSYVMNFEIAILNGFSLDSSKYDSDILRTPSERVFFNWLQKVGAIKFSSNVKNVMTTETLDGYGDDADSEIEYINISNISQLPESGNGNSYRLGNKLYTWKGGEWRSRVLVSKTVQYIGTIDMVNNVSIDYDTFNEIYLNIPAGAGGSMGIFFNNFFDENYQFGEDIDVDNDDFLLDKEKNYIIGRKGDEISENKTLLAIYDDQVNHSYKIDSGYCLNFNDNIYGGIEEMNLHSEDDFEFNCILIYYKIRKSGGKWVTNLYGVLFLEEVSTSDLNTNLNNEDENGGYIQRYPKFKNGNSWGLKLDLKIDAQPDSQLELRDYLYDDPNGGGVGMQMFTDALVQLNDCVKLFYDVKKENTDIEERLYKLENMVSGIDTVYELRDEVGVLRTKVEMLQPTLDLLEGRLDDAEIKISKLETNLGYLISDIKKFETRMYNIESDIKERFGVVESQIDSVESGVSDVKDIIDNLETEVTILDDDSLSITI